MAKDTFQITFQADGTAQIHGASAHIDQIHGSAPGPNIAKPGVPVGLVLDREHKIKHIQVHKDKDGNISIVLHE